MLKKTKLCTGLMVACGGVLLSAGPSALAQQQQQLERVTVTGSNIKRTDTETASPVQVITRQEIERTGKQSIQEILRDVTANGQGSIPTSFSNGFASGSAAISLRGLGVNSTLVLVNGRRMTTYGLADDGTRNFVDLNSLPLDAVERVEVLKDGASAIYGADAVGGVVNIILRKSYNGATLGATYGQPGHSDGQTARAFGTYGFGNLDTDKYNVFFNVEASHQKNIWSTDRGFIGESDLTSKGFYDVTNGAVRPWLGANATANSPYGVIRTPPGNGARVNVIPCDPSIKDPTTKLCRFNPYTQQEIQPDISRLNIFSRGTLQFSPSLSAYMELGLFETKTQANGTLGANNDGGVFNPAAPPDTPILVHGLMTLPAGHPDNPFGVDRALGYRPFELNGRDQTTDNHVFRIVQGFQGTGAGWDFDTGWAWIKSRLENTHTGFINYNVMQNALNNGTYRINLPNTTDPAVLAAVSPSLRTTPESEVKLIDFKASRELMNLEGGPLGVAFGGEARWEFANNPATPGTETGQIVGLGYSAFSGNRRVLAIYGEVTAPVKKWLELSAALRADNYSDFGGSTTPKLGFKVKPTDTLALRGTYSEAFRAPNPAESGGSSFGFTSVGILSLGNPSIQPETAKSYTLGLVWEPVVGSSVTLDWWKINRKNEIIQADPATIIPAGTPPSGGTPNSRLAGALPGSFIYYDDTGLLATVSDKYRNSASTTTDGVDLELRHRMRFAENGNLTGQVFWTHTNKYERTTPSGERFDYAGTQGPIVLSAGAGTPKDRATASLTWDRGPFAITGSVNYVASMKLVDHKGEQAFVNRDLAGNPDGTVTDTTNSLIYNNNGDLNCTTFDTAGNPYGGCKVASFTTFDLFGKWNPSKNWEINASIQNLFDKQAPFDAYLVNTYAINYNQTWHQSGAVGRFFTIGAKYTF